MVKWFDNWKSAIEKIKTNSGTYSNGIMSWINGLFNKNKTTGTENKTQLSADAGTTATKYTAEVTPTTQEATTTSLGANTQTGGVSNAPVSGAITESPTATTPTATTPTEVEEKPMTYEEYIASEKERAEQERADSIKAAETAKERAMVDAQSAYAQNKATYGTNAEQMAQMGLTGGGYSDYLQAQAYAQKRDDVQNANLIEAAQKESANATYSETISTLNQQQIAYNEQKEAEATAKAEAEKTAKDQANDEFKVSVISQIETNGGLSPDYIQFLIDAGMQQDDINDVIAYNQDWYYKTFRNALNVGELITAKDLKTALDDKLITNKKYTELLGKTQENYYNQYAPLMDSYFASVDTKEIDTMYKDGNLSETRYNDLKNKFNSEISSVITAGVLFYKGGALIDEATAKELAQAFKNTGWLSSENSTALDALLTDKYKKEEDGDGGGCFASGTMVTVADGSRVPIETLKEGDDVLVFNHVTGKADTAKILFIYYEGLKEFDILRLNFDGTEDTEVITAHGFFDLDLNKYILVTFDNVAEYVGHKFLCVEYINGETIFKSATLKGYETYKKETECFAVISTKHINSMANDLLTIPDNNNKPPKLLGFGANLFNYNADHTYNKEEMAGDIEKYGLITYDEWCNIAPDNINLSGLFFGIGGEYLKIAVGKGVMTLEELQGYIEIGAKHNGNH